MTKKQQAIRVLLLQIRDQAPVRKEEYESFLCFSGLQRKQLDVLNVFDTPLFEPSVTTGYDALFVGGASEASVLEPESYPFVEPSIDLLRHCLEASLPVFASCFGFQLAVLAMGGTIIRDKNNFEMGTLPVNLTAAARKDTLFNDVPDTFSAVSVHKERANTLPEMCELLAFTQACPHAFRVKGKPFWAFQFHPEVDKATLVKRLTIFKSQYTENDDQLNEVLSSASETPDSNGLLRKFVERVLMH